MSTPRIIRCAGRTIPETNRLSESDRERISAAISEAITAPHAGPAAAWQRIEARETLVRIAAHAIGCSTYDLRMSELDEIAARVVTLVELHTYAAEVAA